MSRAAGGKKFDKMSVARVYFGNWLRDYCKSATTNVKEAAFFGATEASANAVSPQLKQSMSVLSSTSPQKLFEFSSGSSVS
jgi:hypothetical protein